MGLQQYSRYEQNTTKIPHKCVVLHKIFTPYANLQGDGQTDAQTDGQKIFTQYLGISSCSEGSTYTNKDNPSGHQRQKKPRHGVKVDTAAKEKKDLGSYLRNPSINPADISPKDRANKLCANFTCKLKECNNTNCDFAHPRKAFELKCEMIIVIVNHFIKKDVGWFNEYHFMRMPNITDGVQKLLGNTKGPTSKTA